ncbi:MAG: N-acetylglucosamine-6-phosphate deacetylase [Brevefilum sp.]|nr:N-acetylglucosamine-6-phosphate deacetylase [Brevefilum sp.]
MKTILQNGNVVLPDRILAEGAVVIDEQGKIVYVGRAVDLPEQAGETLDLGGKTLSPGLIDIHVHGGRGVTFGEGDLAKNTAAYSEWVVSKGVTGYLMSVAGKSSHALVEMIKRYVEIFNHPPQGAETLGLHLEGPFLNVEKKGAFNPTWLRTPDLSEMKAYEKAANGWIRQMTLAPELPGAEAVAQFCRESGILAAIGHTNTSYEWAEKALREDFKHVTHTFNAQSGFSHRAPGVLGAVLTSDAVSAELIGDMVHVHPGAMKLLLRCLGSERVIAITDAMAGAGLIEGVYELVGHQVIVKDGRATLEDGTLAGSIATMNTCVANLVKHVGLSLSEAIKMASLNPARVIGVADRLGSIEVGKDASLIVIDESINVSMTMVKGHIVYP